MQKWGKNVVDFCLLDRKHGRHREVLRGFNRNGVQFEEAKSGKIGEFVRSEEG